MGVRVEVLQLESRWRVLLTGTPVQNNLAELHSLLHVAAPQHFPLHQRPDFLQRYTDQVFGDNESAGSRQRLLNTLVQLRKCVDHPYLFDGVEPEPYGEGEHLVEASGKLATLDRLLDFLKRNGHKVLLFSQMARTLDILQDYCTFRGLSYERLDGSVRGEERYAAISRFERSRETFAFLLSTKAGGLGLTLTAADTVIFVDSDFNPQNDIQAAARAHRIGQHRDESTQLVEQPTTPSPEIV